MKKLLSLLICIITVLNCLFLNVAASSDEGYSEPEYNVESTNSLEINAKSAVLMDAETGTVLFMKNAAEALPPASVTKIMTLLLVAEAIDSELISLDNTVCVSANAASKGGSQIFIKEGEEFTVEELLKSTVIASANDAAVALAEAVSGTEESFVERMNAALPSCLQIRFCRSVPDEFPALMSLVAGADYRITFAKDEEGRKAASRFADFMALDSFVAQRRTKSGENPCDIRPFVIDGQITETEQEYVIELRTIATQAGMLKPSLWFDSLREFADCGEVRHLIYRKNILAKTKNGKLVPMEEI